jgi:hypothetical protein
LSNYQVVVIDILDQCKKIYGLAKKKLFLHKRNFQMNLKRWKSTLLNLANGYSFPSSAALRQW